jgi:hypothetical protein
MENHINLSFLTWYIVLINFLLIMYKYHIRFKKSLMHAYAHLTYKNNDRRYWPMLHSYQNQLLNTLIFHLVIYQINNGG